MTAWFVLGTVLLVLFLLSLIRVGGAAEYSASGVTAQVNIGPVTLRVYPVKKKKKKKAKKAAPPQEAPAEEPPPKPGGSLEKLKAYLPLITDAAGRLKRKIRVDKLHLDVMTAAEDPALAALSYGYANVAVGMIWPLFEHNFKVKEHRIRTAVDFQTTTPTVYVYAALSLTVGQAVSLGLRLAVKFLRVTAQMNLAQKTEKEAV